MRSIAIAACLLLLAFTVPAVSAGGSECPPFEATYIAPSGVLTDDYGNAAIFSGTEMISATEWAGWATPMTCGDALPQAPGLGEF